MATIPQYLMTQQELRMLDYIILLAKNNIRVKRLKVRKASLHGMANAASNSFLGIPVKFI